MVKTSFFVRQSCASECEPGMDPLSGESVHCCKTNNCNKIISNLPAKVNSCWTGDIVNSVKTTCQPPNNQYCIVSIS